MVEQLTQKMSMMEAGTGPMLAATTGSVFENDRYVRFAFALPRLG